MIGDAYRSRNRRSARSRSTRHLHSTRFHVHAIRRRRSMSSTTRRRASPPWKNCIHVATRMSPRMHSPICNVNMSFTHRIIIANGPRRNQGGNEGQRGRRCRRKNIANHRARLDRERIEQHATTSTIATATRIDSHLQKTRKRERGTRR